VKIIAASFCAVTALTTGGIVAVRAVAAETQARAEVAKTNPKGEKRSGALADCPSKPGPLIEKIKALKDGEWLKLGAPRADPKWGHARGRSWGAKMAYASDVGGAFFNGQGVHGYIKPDGYFMDDIWFYDLYAHRWICLYPGMDTAHFAENVKNGNLKCND